MKAKVIETLYDIPVSEVAEKVISSMTTQVPLNELAPGKDFANAFYDMLTMLASKSGHLVYIGEEEPYASTGMVVEFPASKTDSEI